MTASTTTATAVSPAFHIHPDFGWLNDPNGPVFFDGRWHLFFQHNPDAPVHANVHWAHVSSTDLITWHREPIALFPRPGKPDADGCWSGCVVVEDGVAYAVYSGHPSDSDPGNICLARSDGDLTVWQQPAEPVMTAPDEVAEMRDPFVFSFGGHRWAVVGAGLRDGRCGVLLYECDDIRHWRPAGYLLTSDEPVAADLPAAQVWECPQLAVVDERWVLILSLSRNGAPSDVYYLVGDLVDAGAGARVSACAEAPAFRAEALGLVDAGRDFYAPIVLVDGPRVLMWAWSWEARADWAVAESGWSGMLTLTRELHLEGDRLRHVPAREVAGLRRRDPVAHWLSAGAELAVSPTSQVRCTVGQDFTGTLSLIGPGEEELLAVDVSTGALNWRGALTRFSEVADAARPGGEVVAEFLLDRSIAEATCTGLTSATVRSGSPEGGQWRVRCEAGARGAAAVEVRELGLPEPSC